MQKLAAQINRSFPVISPDSLPEYNAIACKSRMCRRLI